MAISPLSGKPALKAMFADPTQLERDRLRRRPSLYDANRPHDPADERLPGNGVPTEGLKAEIRQGWFGDAEAVHKIRAQSFKDEERLNAVVREALAIVDHALVSTGAAPVRGGVRHG